MCTTRAVPTWPESSTPPTSGGRGTPRWPDSSVAWARTVLAATRCGASLLELDRHVDDFEYVIFCDDHQGERDVARIYNTNGGACSTSCPLRSRAAFHPLHKSDRRSRARKAGYSA